MRAIRLCFFFVFGLLLGAVSVSAFAATPLPGYTPSMNFNYPGGINAPRRAGGPIYDFPDAPGGWGKMRDINKMSIGGRTWDFIGTRNFAPRALAAAGIGLAKRAGPLGIALTLAPLIWDEVEQRWMKPAEQSEFDGLWVHNQTGWQIGCTSPPGCTVEDIIQRMLDYYELDNPSFDYRVSGTSVVSATSLRVFFQYYRESTNTWYSKATQTFTKVGERSEDARPATDAEIEDAIYVELVARGMGSDLARRLIEAGYTPDVDSVSASGPSSIPGGTSTTTTNGPAGTTTTTTNNTYDISYNTNTTNNTTTVTITNNSTTTTTAPDGTTTTTTSTDAPGDPSGSEEVPPEEQKLLCDEFPEASACQKLDVPVEEPPQQEEVTVTFNPSGGFGGSGSCPAPYSFSVQGRSFSIDYQPFCNFFIAVRPVVVAIAFITAMLIALGGYKRD